MKTILAPTDFSEVSLNAVNYAAQMANILGINLTLLHVCPVTMTYTDVPPPALYIEESISKAEKQLKELKAKILKDAPKKITIKTKVLTGDVVSGIKNICEVMDTYAVVMGADSSNTIDRFLFGGNTIEAIKSLSWPLIIVPSKVHFGRLHKIGLACDFRDVASTVPVDEIIKLVKEFNSELHILHVQTESRKTSDLETANATRWLHDQLGALNPKYHFMVSDKVEKSINDFAEKNKLEMLIVTPKKHSFFNKILKSSKSKNIVLQAQVPVLSIHE
ncbi:universal stress protein [Daejeonella sp.]|uniref:universal stress protein n=1 Tax=Daejeonella sp. TaxID=2805397 RepID=UPI0025C4E1EF|nr:universal stress protein [Daejeonella sp.]